MNKSISLTIEETKDVCEKCRTKIKEGVFLFEGGIWIIKICECNKQKKDVNEPFLLSDKKHSWSGGFCRSCEGGQVWDYLYRYSSGECTLVKKCDKCDCIYNH